MGIAAAYLLSSGVSVTYGFIFAPSLFAGLVAAVAPPAALPFVAAVLARSLSVFAAALAYLAAAAFAACAASLFFCLSISGSSRK